jgi:hypothetical protein
MFRELQLTVLKVRLWAGDKLFHIAISQKITVTKQRLFLWLVLPPAPATGPAAPANIKGLLIALALFPRGGLGGRTSGFRIRNIHV